MVTCTRSLSAGFSPATGTHGAFCSRSAVSCASTCSSVTLGTVRLRWNFPMRSSTISGFSSTWNSNVTGPPAPTSHLRLCTCGSATGCSASCASAALQLSDQVLECLLPDVVGELLLDERGGRLPLAESREPGAPLVGGRGARLGLLDLLYRHGHGQGRGPRLLRRLTNLNGSHVRVNLIGVSEAGTATN